MRFELLAYAVFGETPIAPLVGVSLGILGFLALLHI
jgi:hypothetical protein